MVYSYVPSFVNYLWLLLSYNGSVGLQQQRLYDTWSLRFLLFGPLSKSLPTSILKSPFCPDDQFPIMTKLATQHKVSELWKSLLDNNDKVIIECCMSLLFQVMLWANDSHLGFAHFREKRGQIWSQLCHCPAMSVTLGVSECLRTSVGL